MVHIRFRVLVQASVPNTYNNKYVDEIFQVENDQAILAGRQLAQQEGLLVGIFSGAAAFAATGDC